MMNTKHLVKNTYNKVKDINLNNLQVLLIHNITELIIRSLRGGIIINSNKKQVEVPTGEIHALSKPHNNNLTVLSYENTNDDRLIVYYQLKHL